MSVTSGFFNSLNGDRKYNAEQMSAIFNGIINDGVFANIGDVFQVLANGTDNEITVGVGRAWFNGAWVYNDSILPLEADTSELILNRYDAVVIEIDHRDSGRKGDIKIIKGTPSASPSYPTLTRTADLNQYPLAYIYRGANTTSINQANLTNMIGTSSCPYITGILQVTNIDNVVAQWQAQWAVWSAQWPQWEAMWDQWFSEQTQDVDAETSAWLSEMQSDFNSWFTNLQIILDGDVAGNLADQILELQNRFTTLAEERAVYIPIQDSTNVDIFDSNGNQIEGRTVMGADTGEGGSGGGTAGGPVSGDLDMLGHRIYNLGDPTEDLDAVNKKYAEENFLPLTGGAIGGSLGFQKQLNGQSLIDKVQDETNDYGFQLSDTSIAGAEAKVTISGKDQKLTFTTKPTAEGAETAREVIHEGNLVAKVSANVEAADIGAASSTSLSNHTSNSTVHITSSERSTWNSKQSSITGGASSITSSNLTANRALISSSSGKVAVSAVTATELGYLDGVTSKIQTQLNVLKSTIINDTGKVAYGEYAGDDTRNRRIDVGFKPYLIFIEPDTWANWDSLYWINPNSDYSAPRYWLSEHNTNNSSFVDAYSYGFQVNGGSSSGGGKNYNRKGTNYTWVVVGV